MKERLLILLLLTVGCAHRAPLPPAEFLTPHNAILAELVADPKKWDGKFIALRGTVDRLEPGPLGKPLIQLTARDPSGNDHTIWVGSLVKPPIGWMKPGQTIRVAGYFSFIAPWDGAPPESRRMIGDYHLLAQCVVNETTSLVAELEDGIRQCERWRNGEHPERLADPAGDGT